MESESSPQQTGPERVLLGLTGLGIGGGIASVARCVVRALEEEVAAGRLARSDRVLLLDDPRRPPPPPGCGEQRFARGRAPLFAWQLWRGVRRHRPGLVFFDQVGPARSVTLPLPGFPPPRYAVFCHGAELSRAGEPQRARALRGAWRLLTNSQHTARRVRALVPERAADVRPVPLCIDPERTERWAERSGDPDPPREPAALVVGRMWAEERYKGHDELLEAWPEIERRVPGARLWVVGDGDDRARLEAKAAELGVREAVDFRGSVSDGELAGLYRRASVFAMPSRAEGFGLVYAEAMWHGLPCIGSTEDAAGEVIAEGETGELVPYGDVAALAAAVAGLLSDPERRLAWGRAAREHARTRFAYPRFRDDLLRALELGAGSPRSAGTALR